MFLLAGAPVQSVRKALENINIKLMSIEPSVVAGLNKDYKFNFRMSDFEDRYTDAPAEKNKEISALGSYSFLIASMDISNSDKGELIKALHNAKGDIKRDINFIGNGEEQFQLNEFDFLKSVDAANTKTFYSRAKDILLFLISVFATTALIGTFLVWVVSSLKQVDYFRRIYHTVHTVNEHSPSKESNDRSSLQGDIKKLDKGLNELFVIVKNLDNDYLTGGITETHYAFLTHELDRAQNILLEDLGRRLRVLVEGDDNITNNKLKRYYLSGFIDSEQYCDLKI